MKLWIEKQISMIKINQDGFTLMELIIAMVLMAIISMAAFQGLQFAFTALSSSGDYVEDVYVLQTSMEKDLTLVNGLTDTTNASSIVLESTALSVADETIEFDWESGSGCTDFNAVGVTVKRDATGGTYLNRTVYIFIPVVNEDQ